MNDANWSMYGEMTEPTCRQSIAEKEMIEMAKTPDEDHVDEADAQDLGLCPILGMSSR